jgi:parallel beta-helix repeat protein
MIGRRLWIIVSVVAVVGIAGGMLYFDKMKNVEENEPIYAIKLNATLTSTDVFPGDTANYKVNVKNMGKAWDEIMLSYEGTEWVVELDPKRVVLEPNDIAIITVAVVVPAQVDIGEYELQIVATSTNSSAQDRLVLHFQVIKRPELTLHKPIRIERNNGFTEENGVVGGDGTEENPYIIEGWNIIKDNEFSCGIRIEYTNVHFILRNCCIHDWGIKNGVWLYRVSNGIIQKIISYNNSFGIEIERSSNNIIIDCESYNNTWCGIALLYSSDNSIKDCMLYGNNAQGIMSTNSADRITNCSIFNNDNGVDISDSIGSMITDCLIHDNYQVGIEFWNSSNNLLENCTIYNHPFFGMNLAPSSNNNLILNCTIYNSSIYGITISHNSNDNEVANCEIYQNNVGMEFLSGQNNIVRNCRIENNRNGGILLQNSSFNQIKYCNIENNGKYGIYILCHFLGSYHPSNDNTIHRNNFVDNEQNAMDEGANHWDDGSEGNYWSDYTGNDADGDGIGDTPYSIPGGSNQDCFPLINPILYSIR